jgi:hypothetical protein
MTAERERSETGSARYKQWAADTQARREAAGKAKAELERRGLSKPGQEPQPQPIDQPQTTTESWREFEANIQAVERAIAASTRPPPTPANPGRRSAHSDQPPPSALSPDHVPDNRAARLDQLLARTERAAQRVAAQRAERHASSEYAARIEREAVAEPESGRQAEARDGAEMEL